jgi:hypothetical protein
VPDLAWTLLSPSSSETMASTFLSRIAHRGRHYRAAAIGAPFLGLCVLTATTLFAAAGAWRS